MGILEDREREDVYGVTYERGAEEMAVTEQALLDRYHRGFDTAEECSKFAHDVHAGMMLLNTSGHTFLLLDHHGYTLKPNEWKQMYGGILFYKKDAGGKIEFTPWSPDPFLTRNNARINSEAGDGHRKPLYYRDYHRPVRYYNESEEKFNTARPFKYFAKETGADTSFIYTLIDHLAGANAPYLLAWLRRKMVRPYEKTEVMPVFTGGQGTGKSSFAECICKALFGEENVIVSYQYDSSSRFNADQADALVVSIEEKTQDDKRNSSSALKSSTTATHVRKENKGIDPSYQKSYTEYIISTNDDVPLKFEDGTDQRRFMIMEADPEFTRGESALADEVFTKLYGKDAAGNVVGRPLADNREVVEQFKHELYSREDIKNTNPKDFVRTDAYYRCFGLPRTNESVEIEAVMKSLAPFIKESLLKRELVDTLEMPDSRGGTETIDLHDYIPPDSVVFFHKWGPRPDTVVLCRPLIFSDSMTRRPFAHSVVEKTLRQMRKQLKEEFGIELMASTSPPPSGFPNMKSIYRNSAAAWFRLPDQEDVHKSVIHPPPPPPPPMPSGELRKDGYYPRYNAQYQWDEEGCFEVLNPLPLPRAQRKADSVLSMGTFLLEADEASSVVKEIERKRLENVPTGGVIEAEELYAERLSVQEKEAEKLIAARIARRVVYSGAKSLHILVTVKDAPKDKEERRWLDSYIKEQLGGAVVYDASTSDAARLTRYPFRGEGMERITTVEGRNVRGMQRVLAEDDGTVWDLKWRKVYERWKQRPRTLYEQRGKLLPSKPIYTEAAQALLIGNFFTDPRFDGKRNAVFFPAYRLIRAMGYSADEFWREAEGDIDSYPKREERYYWRSRETCDLIRSIDAEFDQ
jgi:hypothetical protein